MQANQSAVLPVNPAAPYVGGKKNLSKAIIARLGGIPHEIYAEPFVGMGGVFLRRTVVPRSEVINDYSQDVAGFFRILQRHYPQFMDMLRFQVTSRANFERLRHTDPSTLTDLERAARFLYLQRLSYGGKVASRVFGVAPGRGGRFNLNTLGPMLEELHERLAGVVIECLDFEQFLIRYDTVETLFYLDPPYFGSETYYGKELFSRQDFTRLAEVLREIKGKWLMSINDCEQVRSIFSGCRMEVVETTYSVHGRGVTKNVVELLISS